MSAGKASAYLELLAEHSSVPTYVVAAECTGLPRGLSALTRLDIGLNMPVPIDPLYVDEKGITAGLSFDRVHALVVIPWSAVCGVRFDSGAQVLLNTDALKRAVALEPSHAIPSAVLKERPKPRAVPAPSNVVRVDFRNRRRAP